MARKWGEVDGSGTKIAQSFTQSELGAFAGVARENTNRILRGWTEDKLVSFENGVIVLHDLDRLADCAEL